MQLTKAEHFQMTVSTGLHQLLYVPEAPHFEKMGTNPLTSYSPGLI